MSHPHASANQTSTTAPDGGPAKVQWNDPQRAAAFARWLHALVPVHGLRPETLAPASADASFRRYLRIAAAGGSLIIMDAPPDKEDSRPFDHVAGLMARAGLLVPQVLDWSQQSGFLLLTDLGCQSMMQALNTEQPAANLALYQQAVEALVTWQLASRPGGLPPFDAALMRRELDLFAQWYMVQHRKMVLDAGLQRTLDTLFETIIAECLAWPSVYVHADFMPRNLMLQQPAVGSDTPVCRLGVLDFQDAVYGPITYDIASLMRDAFLSWDEDFVLDVTIRYWELARRRGLPVGDDFGAFYRGVEWMGLQRHLRIAGVFARLSLRDGKPQYLADAPRFIGYLRATAARYRELRPLSRLLDLIEGTQEAGGFAFGRV